MARPKALPAYPDVPDDATHGAIPGLLPLLYPIDRLTPMPGNPRRGDVDAVATSYQKFGQRKPIVAKADGTVIAGNHQTKAAIELGWSHIAVVFVNDDDKTAKAYALADNKTGDLGDYDTVALGELIRDLQDEPELLAATAFSDGEVSKLLAQFDEPDTSPGPGLGTPVVSYQIVFDDETQQKRWYTFTRWLRSEYPGTETMAERLDVFLAAQGHEPA